MRKPIDITVVLPARLLKGRFRDANVPEHMERDIYDLDADSHNDVRHPERFEENGQGIKITKLTKQD